MIADSTLAGQRKRLWPTVEGNLARELAAVPAPRYVRRFRLKTTFFIAVAAILAVSLVLGYLAQSAAIVRLTYQKQELEQTLARLEQEQGELELKVAELGSLERVERRARQLGMVGAEADQVKVVVPAGTRRSKK